MIEEDQQEEARAAQQWGKKAQAASKKADELRATGTVRRPIPSTTWPGWHWSGR